MHRWKDEFNGYANAKIGTFFAEDGKDDCAMRAANPWGICGPLTCEKFLEKDIQLHACSAQTQFFSDRA